jgi:hypothetical protein
MVVVLGKSMGRDRAVVVVVVAAVLAATMSFVTAQGVLAAPPPSGSTARVSVSTGAAQASGSASSISADGRWVAFVSSSTALAGPLDGVPS